MDFLRRKDLVLIIFIFSLSLNISLSYQKIQNATKSRSIFKLSRRVFPFVHSIRFANEQLTLQGNEEVFLNLSSLSTFRLTADVKLSKGALLYVFFHLRHEDNPTGYAFRMSNLPHVPTAFLKYNHAHVVSTKPSLLPNQIFSASGWRHITVESYNNMHVLRVDGEKVLSVHDKSYISGEASIGSGVKPFTMDNLVVKSGALRYSDDFSIKSSNNKDFSPSTRKIFLLFFFLLFLFLFFLSRRLMNVSEEEKNVFYKHLRVQILLLFPGAILKNHDVFCFVGTFMAVMLFLARAFSLFVKTNVVFLPPAASEASAFSFSSFARRQIRNIAVLLCALFIFYFFIRSESRIPCELSTCKKTLLVRKPVISFRASPYFLMDSINVRDPALSFDIYGDEGLAVLVFFNKLGKENTFVDTSEGFHLRDAYVMLLSFNKTLPTLLMRGKSILKAASGTPFLKRQWNHVEILASGRNILFFMNGRKILSYDNRKLFSGGFKILPMYNVPQIKNLRVYRLKIESAPVLFNVLDVLFFLLRLYAFILVFLCLSCFILHPTPEVNLQFFIRRAKGLFAFPFSFWVVAEILTHSRHALDDGTLLSILRFLSLCFMILSFFSIHFLFIKRAGGFSLKKAALTVLLTVLFLEGLCWSTSPYTDALRRPWYVFVHDKNHFWYFDPHVHMLNEYFNLNKVRSQKVAYDKGTKKRIAVFGSSSAYGQFFPELSSQIFSAQLEKKLLRHGYPCEVLNFAIQGSTTFTGVVFLKGIYSLFKPDIILWNYALNDMLFMHGTFRHYDFLETLYTRKRFFPFRLLYSSATFQSLAHFVDSTWVQALMYAPFPGYKRKQYKKNISVLYDFCRKNNVKLVLLHETSDRTLWFGYNRRRKIFLDTQDKWFYDALHSFSEKYHIPYVFTIPELSKYRDDRLYLDGVHYSRAGHDKMADILYDFLTRKNGRGILFSF